MPGVPLLLSGGAASGARAIPEHQRPGAGRRPSSRGLPGQAPVQGEDGRPGGRAEPARPRVHPLRDPGGARRLDARGDPSPGAGKLPRLGDAPRLGSPVPRPRGPVRVRLPDPAHRRGHDPRRAPGGGARRRRPPRLGRGLPARRRLDRARRHERPLLRRGAHPARLRCQPRAGCPRHRDLRRRGRLLLVRDAGGEAGARGPADDPVLRGDLEGAARGIRPRRRGARPGRARIDRGWRAHLQLAAPPRGARVAIRGHRPHQVGAGGGARRRAARPAGAGRSHPAARGQVVPRREPAPVGARRGGAPGRDAPLVRWRRAPGGQPGRRRDARPGHRRAPPAGRRGPHGGPGGSLASRPRRGRPSTRSECPGGEPGRRRGAAPAGPRPRPRALDAGGLRAAAGPHRGSLAHRPMGVPARGALPHPGRRPGRASPSAQVPGRAAAPAGRDRAFLRHRPAHRGGRPGPPPGGGRPQGGGRQPARGRGPQAAGEAAGGSHRSLRRAARRRAVRLPSAPPVGARLHRAGPGRRRRGPGDRARGPARGLPASLEPRGDPLLGDTRPRASWR